VVESFGFFKSQQVQALFLLFFKHFKPIFGEILVDGYLSGMGLSEKINHTLKIKWICFRENCVVKLKNFLSFDPGCQFASMFGSFRLAVLLFGLD